MTYDFGFDKNLGRWRRLDFQCVGDKMFIFCQIVELDGMFHLSGDSEGDAIMSKLNDFQFKGSPDIVSYLRLEGGPRFVTVKCKKSGSRVAARASGFLNLFGSVNRCRIFNFAARRGGFWIDLENWID